LPERFTARRRKLIRQVLGAVAQIEGEAFVEAGVGTGCGLPALAQCNKKLAVADKSPDKCPIM
jgi:hypothetical protein